jgi:hypothetical protein
MQPALAQPQSCANISIASALFPQGAWRVPLPPPISAAWLAGSLLSSSCLYPHSSAFICGAFELVVASPHTHPQLPTPSHPPPNFAIHEPWPTTS